MKTLFFVILALGAGFCQAQNLNINLNNTWIEGVYYSIPPDDLPNGLSAHIQYTIEAVDSDAWVWLTAAESNTGFNTGIFFSVQNASTGETVLSAGTLPYLSLISGGIQTGREVKILAGFSAVFDLQVNAQMDYTGAYRVQLDSIKVYPGFAENGLRQNFPDGIESNALLVQGIAPIPEASTNELLAIGGGALLVLVAYQNREKRPKK